MTETVKLKVASANLNQTIQNFTRNVPNIKAAIDKAVEDGADILCLQELGLTGYTGDGCFDWIRTPEQGQLIMDQVNDIAEYAKSKDPNLVISLGLPFFYKDDTQPVGLDIGTTADGETITIDNPLYNRTNKPYNAQIFIGDGKVLSISAKAEQPEGAAEYEPRQFAAWPKHLPISKNVLEANVAGNKVPFGRPVLALKKGGKAVHLFHEICAEAWPGIKDDGSINKAEQDHARYLNRVAGQTDLSLIINPSASKPEPAIDKMKLRELLCTTGSKIAKGAGYIYTNCAGNESGYTAFEAGSLFAANGKVVHRGERYNFGDVTYSSAVLEVPVASRGVAHATIEHDFKDHALAKVGGAAEFESSPDRQYKETIRNVALWLRDYIEKNEQQGYVISLSGGKDSAFGAAMVTTMIDLSIKDYMDDGHSKEEAVSQLMERFHFLKYKDEVLAANEQQGADAAIKLLKEKFLTCIYMPSNNSSEATLDAARTLVEGGKDGNGKPIAGIGGTFRVINVQDVVDSCIEAFSGLVRKDIPDALYLKAKDEIAEYVKGQRTKLSEDVATQINHHVPSWSNKEDNITLQNIQARARLPIAWLHANQEGKIACVTSNLSEAFAGYWTFGGDGHMGSINPCGGIFKSDLTRHLHKLEEKGIVGLPPIEGLYLVNMQRPSAELRPLDAKGEIVQYDEDDMMPYEQLDAIARAIVVQRKDPVVAYKELKNAKDPEGNQLFASNEELLACIEQCCWRWDSSQFKRVASVIAPFLGENMDPHQSVRTTIISDMFKQGRALLKLEYLREKIGEEALLRDAQEPNYSALTTRALNTNLRDRINKTSIEDLMSHPEQLSKTHRFVKPLSV